MKATSGNLKSQTLHPLSFHSHFILWGLFPISAIAIVLSRKSTVAHKTAVSSGLKMLGGCLGGSRLGALELADTVTFACQLGRA